MTDRRCLTHSVWIINCRELCKPKMVLSQDAKAAIHRLNTSEIRFLPRR